MQGQDGRGSTGLRLVVAAALLLSGLIAFRSDLAFLFAPDPQLAFRLFEDPYNGVISPRGRVALEGVVPGPYGFYVPPGGRGRVRYETSWTSPSTPWMRLELSALLDQTSPRGRVSLSVDGGRTWIPLAENRSLRLESLDVGSLLRGRQQMILLYEGTNTENTPLLLMAKISLLAYAEPPSPAPPLGRAMAAILWFGLGLGLLSPSWPRQLPLLAILAVGFAGRYSNFLRVLYGRPDPDAEYYRILAEKLVPFGSTGFYSGSFDIREPFFLLVAKAAFVLLGSSDTHLRFVSLAASLLAIVLAWRLGGRLLGAGWAWLPAAGLAFSVPLVVESGRGLRLEVEMVLLLLFADVLFVAPRLRQISRFVLAGLVGGLLVLTRSSHMPGLIVLLVLGAGRWAARPRRRLLLAGVAGGLIAGLYAPHAAALYRIHGDAFYDQARHSRWFANKEFAGQPGFPSKDEVARDAYTGPRITFWEYVFKRHTPGQVVLSYFRGYGKMLYHMDLIGWVDAVQRFTGLRLDWVDWVVRLLGWAGMLLALRSRQAWLSIAILALLFPVAFPYDRGVTERYRLTLMVFPFFLCGIGLLCTRMAAALHAVRVARVSECSRA